MAVMLLEWVFTSAFLIMVVLALRAALGRRVSAKLRYALWAVVLARLLVPVQLFTSPIAGTWVLTERRTERNAAEWPAASDASAMAGADDVPSLTGPDGPAGDLSNFPQAPNPPAVPDPPEPPGLNNLPGWTGYLGWAWLAGSIAVAFVLLVSNLRFYRSLRRVRVPLDGADCPLRVYAAEGLPSPCLFGVINPAAYVTPEAAADPAMLRHVLAHEYTHYRHGDHIWSLLRCAALAAHWWNPLAWLAARLSQRDGELACDEGALKRLGEVERAGYGNTLLALVTARPRPGDLFRCATTMTGDKKSLKERISRIACAPKRILWAAAVAVLVTALACVCAFGQAAEEPRADEPEPSPSSSAPVESNAPADDGLSALDLSFSIGEYGNVTISGTVNGLPLGENTYWRPAADAEHPITYLALENPPSIGGNLEAWWLNDSRTSVVASTAPTMVKFAGDDPNAGFWSFIVDLSEGAGVVTEMHDMAGMPAQADSEAALRFYPEAVSNEEAIAVARLAAKLMTAAEDYYNNNVPAPSSDEWEEHRVLMFHNPDLNRDGAPETIATSPFDDGMGKRVGVWQGADVGNYEAEWWKNADLLWTDEGHNAHAGWNAVFLCTLDGEDYLLRYHPTMYQGSCSYSYQLFTLENGEETVVQENSIQFDINFGLLMHTSFDPKAISAFMEEINGLLAQSIQLINTDTDLLDTFEKNERLEDTLGWLDWWEPEFVRDGSASLLDSLLAYQEAMTPPTIRAADALNLGNIVEYSLQADGVHCRLGCDASGKTLNYIGYLDVALGYRAWDGFRCVSAQYTPYEAL